MRTLTSYPSEYRTPSTGHGGTKWASQRRSPTWELVCQMKVRLRLTVPASGMPTQFAALLLESLSASHPDPLTALRTYLSSLPTPTAIHSSIQTLTRVLLLHTALHTGSSHLVLGTSLTSLAVSLISGVAQGAGFNVREDTMEEWTPDPETQPTQEGPQKTKKQPKRTVRVVRPLRDIGMKECAAWAWWSRIPVVGKEKWVWPGAKPGIGTLTKGAPQLVLCM